MLHMMTNSQRNQNILIAILAIFTLLVGYFQSLQLLNETHCAQKTRHATEAINSVAKSIDSEITHITEDIRSLSKVSVLNEFIQTPKAYRQQVSENMLQWAKTRKKYFQIQILDKNGLELYRLEKGRDNQVNQIPLSELQSKKDRYYVIEGKQLQQEQIYLSPLDLNRQGNQIIQPLQPTLRMVKGLYDQNQHLIGMIVLNYDANYLIDKLKSFSSTNMALLNSKGYWLHSSNEENNWGFMFDALHNRFSNKHPEIWQQLDNQEAGTIEAANDVWVFKKVYPLRTVKLGSTGKFEETAMQTHKDYRWILISRHNLKNSRVYEHSQALLFWLTVSSVVAILLIAFLAIRLSHQKQRSVIKSQPSDLSEEIETNKSTEFGRQEALNYFVDQGNQAMLVFEGGKVSEYNPLAFEWLGSKPLQSVRLKEIVTIKNRESLIQAIKYLDKKHHIKTNVILQAADSKENTVCVNVFGSKDSFVMLLTSENDQ